MVRVVPVLLRRMLGREGGRGGGRHEGLGFSGGGHLHLLQTHTAVGVEMINKKTQSSKQVPPVY